MAARNILTRLLLAGMVAVSQGELAAYPQDSDTSLPASYKPAPTGDPKATCPKSIELSDIDQLLQLREYPQAISLLERAKRCNPRDLRTQEELIVAYLRSNQKQKAMLVAESATQSSPPEAAVSVAQVLNVNQDFIAAQAILKPFVDSGFKSAGIPGELGISLLGQGQYEEAVRALGTAVQIDATSERYSLELGRALLSWGNYGTALDFLEAIRDRFGMEPNYLYEKGWALYGMKRFDDAVDVLLILLKEKPNWDLAHYSLGNVYWMQGDLESAEKQYRAAITLQDKNANYFAALGRELRKKDGAMPEAITVLNRAIKLDPHNDPAEFELALAYRSQGQLEKAKHLLEDLTAREPGIVDAHQVLGMIYYQLHSPNDGARQIAMAAELERNARQRASRMPSSNVSESGDAVAYQ